MSEPANSTPAGPAAGASREHDGDGPFRPHDGAFGPLDSPLNHAEKQEPDNNSAEAGASTQQGK